MDIVMFKRAAAIIGMRSERWNEIHVGRAQKMACARDFKLSTSFCHIIYPAEGTADVPEIPICLMMGE